MNVIITNKISYACYDLTTGKRYQTDNLEGWAAYLDERFRDVRYLTEYIKNYPGYAVVLDSKLTRKLFYVK